MYGKKVESKTLKVRLLQSIIEAGFRVFETEDVKAIAQVLDIDPQYTLSVISGLIRDGWMQPLKKGVYKLTQSTGIAPIHEFEIAMHMVKPAMISYYSAFYHHGLTEQVPKIVYITTLKEGSTPQDGRLIKRAGFRIDGIDYQIVQLKKEKFFGGIQAWRGESRFWISDLERTLLEGFASPQYCGGFSEVMHGLNESLLKLNIDKLISYASLWNIAVGRRIGWALEQFGIENKQTLSLAKIENPGYRLLDPSRNPQGDYSNKWRLQINI